MATTGIELERLFDTPRWDEGGRVHNWRNYISADLRAIWHTLTLTQKCVIAQNAQDIADREHWD